MENSTLKWLWRVPGRKKGLIAALTAVQILLGGYGVLYALLLRNIVDSAVAHDSGAFWRSVLWIILLVLCQLGLQALIRWLNELSKATLENSFKQRLAESILRKDYASVSALHTGEWMNRLTNDTAVVAGGYVEILPGLAGMIVKLVSALVMLVVLDRHFALILIPGGAALVVITYAFRKVLKRLHRNIQESDGRLRSFLQERLSSLMIIKAFAAEKQTAREAAEKLDDHKAARMKRNRFSNLCNAGFGAAMHGMYLFGVVYCAWGILTGTVSYGTLTAVMQLMSQIQAPFANISGYLPRWYAMMASAERLMEVESFPDDSEEPPKSLEEAERYYREDLRSFGLRDVRFAYPGEAMPAVLKNLTLEIRKGEIVAFTGQSGCGKTTVLKLLLCLYAPLSGECFLDTQPLTAARRRLFAYVPQGNALMSGTIREIVSFANPAEAHNEHKLWNALYLSCAAEFAGELQDGVDTLLGERGTGLSEGQMQRLAIARAIFSESPILLLDEATSALDAETEKQLLDNLRRLTEQTVVIVTHRPAALSVCDRVLQFSESGVKEVSR